MARNHIQRTETDRASSAQNGNTFTVSVMNDSEITESVRRYADGQNSPIGQLVENTTMSGQITAVRLLALEKRFKQITDDTSAVESTHSGQQRPATKCCGNRALNDQQCVTGNANVGPITPSQLFPG